MKIKTIVQDGIIPTLCRQCDMHCGINVHIKNGRIVDITGIESHPQNRGKICHKGLASIDTVYHQDRILKPLKRDPNGNFKKIPLNQALDEITDAIIKIKNRFGKSSISVWKGEAIGFAQQEDYARRFIRAFGSPNYFSCDSQCFASRYLAYSLMQGYWSCCPDFANARLIILWGTNPPLSHPTFMPSIGEALDKGAKLIVIDPRLTNIAYQAHKFIQPMPGTDGALAWGIIRFLIKNNGYDRNFVKNYSIGFDEFAEYANRFTPEFVENQTGIPKKEVIEIGTMIASNIPHIANYVGVSLEHQYNGVQTIRTIAGLGGICGAVDIKGGDPWYKGMGGRDLKLYQSVQLPDEKPIGADKFPVLYDFRKECHTMTAMEYILGKGEYPLRSIIMTAANPVITNPNEKKVREAFSMLDLFVVRDLFLTETAKLAHYVIPAASFLERSELHYYSQLQRVAVSTKIAEIPDVMDEYSFWRELAYRLGFGNKYFPWKNEEEVNRWILEPTNITLEELKKHPEGIQYAPIEYRKYQNIPLPTPSGKFEFKSKYLEKLGYPALPEYEPPIYTNKNRKKYPFILLTGARKYLFTHSRFRNIERFRTVHPEAEIEIHPSDASHLGISNGSYVKITSEIGSMVIKAHIVDKNEILPGIVQITHGWDNEENVNKLTYDLVNDPISGFSHINAVPVQMKPVQQSV